MASGGGAAASPLAYLHQEGDDADGSGGGGGDGAATSPPPQAPPSQARAPRWQRHAQRSPRTTRWRAAMASWSRSMPLPSKITTMPSPARNRRAPMSPRRRPHSVLPKSTLRGRRYGLRSEVASADRRSRRGGLVTASQATALSTIQRLDPIYVDITQSSADQLRLRQKLLAGSLTRGTARLRLKLEDEVTIISEH